MAEQWILDDHTWIEVRMKGKLLHSLNGRPIPYWMGGAIHLPSFFAAFIAAAAGFVIFGSSPSSCCPPPTARRWSCCLMIEVVGPLVAVFATWRKVNVIQWARTQLDWVRQDRRSATNTSGGSAARFLLGIQVHGCSLPTGRCWLARACPHCSSSRRENPLPGRSTHAALQRPRLNAGQADSLARPPSSNHGSCPTEGTGR